MSRTAIVVQSIPNNTGAVVTMSAADASANMALPNDGHTDLLVENGGAVSCTVAVHSVACSHGRIGDLSIVMAAGTRAIIGPLDPALFNQPTDPANVWVDFTESSVVTVGARKH
jgi:hypothetical protein